MAEHLVERLKIAGQNGVHVEGLPQADWVLIDAGDAIVHLFRPEVRAFYTLEKMWGEESVAVRMPDGSRTPPPTNPIHDIFISMSELGSAFCTYRAI